VFSISFATKAYKPPRVVTLRTDVDRWEQNDIGGTYGPDGAWHFRLPGARYRPGHRFKLVLDHVLYMDGPDQTLTAAPDYHFDDSSARFSYTVRYVTERYRDRRVTLRTSADQYQSDQPGVYSDGAWNFSVSEPRVHAAEGSFKIQFVLDGVAASNPRTLNRTRQHTYFTDPDISCLRPVKLPEARATARPGRAGQPTGKQGEKATPPPVARASAPVAALSAVPVGGQRRVETALREAPDPPAVSSARAVPTARGDLAPPGPDKPDHPDDPGLQAIPADPVTAPSGPGTSYVVTGTVTSAASAAVGGLELRLVDKNVGGDIVLSSGQSNVQGQFTLKAELSARTLEERHKRSPDLQAQVLRDGAVVVRGLVDNC
jgi:hypothetical protein